MRFKKREGTNAFVCLSNEEFSAWRAGKKRKRRYVAYLKSDKWKNVRRRHFSSSPKR